MSSRLELKWRKYKERPIHGSNWKRNFMEFDYDENQYLKDRIAEALSFWSFVREQLSCHGFMSWNKRQKDLSVFYKNKNFYIGLIARIESLPTTLWRKILWKHNIDFMSKESFLRRINNTQVQEIMANHDDLFVRSVLPRVFSFWDKNIKRISVPLLMNEEYDSGIEEKKMMTKGAMSYDLLGLDFGFNAYKNGENDDTCDFHISAGRFLSLKNHSKDFVVNQEDGLYWWFYRTARSNAAFNRDETVKLSDHICPGFWLTLIVHLFFWIISPVSGIALLIADKPIGAPVYIGASWAACALITPAWVAMALLMSAVDENKFAKAVTSPIWFPFWAIGKIYSSDWLWLDRTLATIIGLLSVLVLSLSFTFNFNKIIASYSETTAYIALVFMNLLALGILYLLRFMKDGREYGRTKLAIIALIASFVASLLSLPIANLFFWVKSGVLEIIAFLQMYYDLCATLLMIIVVGYVISFVLAKGTDAYCDRINQSRGTTSQKTDEMDQLLYKLNAVVMTSLLIFTVFIAYKLITGNINWTLESILVTGLPITSLLGISFGAFMVTGKVKEERPRIKYLRRIIKNTEVGFVWQRFVYLLEKNKPFMAMKDKPRRELLKSVNKLLVTRLFPLATSKEWPNIIELFARKMSVENYTVLSEYRRELYNMNQEQKWRVVVNILNGMSFHGALIKSQRKPIVGKKFRESFVRICLKPLDYLRVLHRIYKIFNEYCPYVARPKVIE